MATVTRVGIGVVEHGGRYLVGIRGADIVLSGKAEFPGGKVKEGEEPRQTVIRECREETGLNVTPVRFLQVVRHTYDHGTVELHFWLCKPAAEDVPGQLRGFRWLSPAEMASLDWPAANRAVLEVLSVEV